MTSKEIVKLFREGLSIDRLSEKEHEQQKDARAKRQTEYRAQSNLIRREKAKDKKYKFNGVRVVIGKPCTKFAARSIIEQAIYADLMAQSKGGKEHGKHGK